MKHIKTNQHNHKRQPRINSRAKGASGEREVCSILSKLTGGMVVTRSLESVRSGGADITCIPGLSIEVKRKKYVLPNDMSAFWLQCISQAEDTKCKPVLFSKEDRRQWLVTVALGDVFPVQDMKCLPLTMGIDAFKILYERWNNEQKRNG